MQGLYTDWIVPRTVSWQRQLRHDFLEHLVQRGVFGRQQPRRGVFMVRKSRQMSGGGIVSVVIAEEETLPNSVVIAILDHLQGGPREQELFKVELRTIGKDKLAFDEPRNGRPFLVSQRGRRHERRGGQQRLQGIYVVSEGHMVRCSRDASCSWR